MCCYACCCFIQLILQHLARLFAFQERRIGIMWWRSTSYSSVLWKWSRSNSWISINGSKPLWCCWLESRMSSGTWYELDQEIKCIFVLVCHNCVALTLLYNCFKLITLICFFQPVLYVWCFQLIDPYCGVALLHLFVKLLSSGYSSRVLLVIQNRSISAALLMGCNLSHGKTTSKMSYMTYKVWISYSIKLHIAFDLRL